MLLLLLLLVMVMMRHVKVLFGFRCLLLWRIFTHTVVLPASPQFLFAVHAITAAAVTHSASRIHAKHGATIVDWKRWRGQGMRVSLQRTAVGRTSLHLLLLMLVVITFG